MADEELKKAFQDLQFKTNETRQRIALGEHNKRVNIQKQKISETTRKAVEELKNPDFKYYRGIGRMFVLTNQEAELKRHETEASEYKNIAENTDKQRSYLEKSLKEAEENLREMVQSRRS